MASTFKNFLTDEDKIGFIDALTENLPALRAKVGVSQGDLAKLIGVSRQTYCAVESNLRSMSWNTYLSLILFFDYHPATHQMLRDISAFPVGFVEGMNKGGKSISVDASTALGANMTEMLACLDEQALRAVRTVLMVEYARCAGLSDEAVIKAFNGVQLNFQPSRDAGKATRAYRRLKNKQDET